MPSVANHSEMLCYVGVSFAKHTIEKKDIHLGVLVIQRLSQESGHPNFTVVSVSQRRPVRVAVIAGELIDANVRLSLAANRTYGLPVFMAAIYLSKTHILYCVFSRFWLMN